MNRTLQRATPVGLTVCLLLLSGLIYPQTVAHAGHHAHHNAATHASALCSWMCAAGQVLEGASVVFQSDFNPIGIASPVVVQEPVSAAISTFLSRGPPSLR
ncbi:MAG: hypothetical protein ACRDGM_03600 [bacterium]